MIKSQILMLASEGFELWKLADASDSQGELQESGKNFRNAALQFFEDGRDKHEGIARALFEYSTIMDAFSSLQEARILKSKLDFEKSLDLFSRSAEILRASVHFAFLSSYISGCASLETAVELGPNDDALQGYRNAIALLEQSKLALSFRDEKHLIVKSINALIKFAVSRASMVEVDLLNQAGRSLDAVEKNENVEEKIPHQFRIGYFPLDDWSRATNGSFLVIFSEPRNLWVGNVGKNEALVQKIGGMDSARNLLPGESFSFQLNPLIRGKIRILYRDLETNVSYDEGCGTLI